MIKYKTVTLNDAHFLFELLKEREKYVNISHVKMPTFKTHCQFILSNPYQEWNIILADNKEVGSIYIDNRKHAGLFLKKEYQRKGYGREVMQFMIKKYGKVKVNINPYNLAAHKFLEALGFTVIQNTYELT